MRRANRIEMPRTGEGGFTLVEMLAVITIIVILATTSTLFFLQFTQSRGLRAAATEFESTFNQASRLASNTRQPHYLRFQRGSDQTKARLSIIRDVDPEDSDDPNVGSLDRMVSQQSLPPFAQLALGDHPDAGPAVNNNSSGPWWVKFAGDGSMIDASGDNPIDNNRSMNEIGASDPSSGNAHDFLIFRKSGDRVYIDWEPVVGKIVGKVFGRK